MLQHKLNFIVFYKFDRFNCEDLKMSWFSSSNVANGEFLEGFAWAGLASCEIEAMAAIRAAAWLSADISILAWGCELNEVQMMSL